MLEASDLELERGGRRLFRSLSLALAGGELLRVVGANGSGKTTLLKILCGLLSPQAGEVRWEGTPIRLLREEFSKQLLYLGHAPAVKEELTAAENLAIACTLAGVEAAPQAVREVLEAYGRRGATCRCGGSRKDSAGAPRSRGCCSRARHSTAAPSPIDPECRKVFDDVETGIREGRPAVFSQHFGPQVQIHLRGFEGGYVSSAQAYYVLENFFQGRRPVGMRLTTFGDTGGAPMLPGAPCSMRVETGSPHRSTSP